MKWSIFVLEKHIWCADDNTQSNSLQVWAIPFIRPLCISTFNLIYIPSPIRYASFKVINGCCFPHSSMLRNLLVHRDYLFTDFTALGFNGNRAEIIKNRLQPLVILFYKIGFFLTCKRSKSKLYWKHAQALFVQNHLCNQMYNISLKSKQQE